MPDYHSVLEKYGLQVLEVAGFLNDTDVEITSDIRVLHPVFRRNLWRDMTKEQYAMMRPSILLATAILDDPVTLCYFHALAVPAREMKTILLDTFTAKTDCKVVMIPDVLTAVEQREIFNKLCKT
ncbi:hypothetical protein E4T39_03904 [Aureobasidium subglaciale]|nr:hypothetical protein E4T39_03904 [Aureobasidium subglaciale]